MKAKILSAGVVVVHRVKDRCVCLLLRAYNYWDFPKGLVERGEAADHAACREVREEAGLSHLDFRWGLAYHETEPYGHGKVARYYVAETRDTCVVLPVSPELGRPEHHEYRWLAFDEARSLVVPRLLPILDWAAQLTGCAAVPSPDGPAAPRVSGGDGSL